MPKYSVQEAKDDLFSLECLPLSKGNWRHSSRLPSMAPGLLLLTPLFTSILSRVSITQVRRNFPDHSGELSHLLWRRSQISGSQMALSRLPSLIYLRDMEDKSYVLGLQSRHGTAIPTNQTGWELPFQNYFAFCSCQSHRAESDTFTHHPF